MREAWSAGLLGGLAALSVTGVHAKPLDVLLTLPREIALHVHADLQQRDFMGPLLCALRRAIAVPVTTRDIDVALQGAQATPAQLDVDKVAALFDWASAGYPAPTFRYLLIPHDMKKPTNSYAFAWTYHHATRLLGIVSTARIEAKPTSGNFRQPANVTAARAYKLILKSVGRLAGLENNDSCLLNLSSTVADLDQKSREFCPDDRDRLVAAGVLKPQEEDNGDCAVSSERRDGRQLARID